MDPCHDTSITRPQGTMLNESLSVPQSRAAMHEPLSSCSDDDDNECENQQSICDGDDSDIENEEVDDDDDALF